MRNCNRDRMCGDTTLQKWLAKVTMGNAYSLLIALLCVACSREPKEVYQAPYAVLKESQSENLCKNMVIEASSSVEPIIQEDFTFVPAKQK